MIECWRPYTSLFIFLGVLSQLTVTSLPEALFLANGGIRNVVQGTVIQLYCVVQSANVTFSWTKDGDPVVLDVPHLRERTCNNATTSTSVLTIETFQISDNGTYLCSAVSADGTGVGDSTTLTGLKFLSLISYVVLRKILSRFGRRCF